MTDTSGGDEPSGLLRAIRSGRMDRLTGDDGDLVTRTATADRRAAHLKVCLNAVRQAGAGLSRVSDARALLDQLCARLVDSHAYEDAWIALLDRRGWVEYVAVSPGLETPRESLARALRSDPLPYCVRRAMAESATVAVDDPPSLCGDCPLAQAYPGLARLARVVSFADRVYGVIAVAIPADCPANAEEQAILDDLAGDLAFTLHKIEHMAAVDEITTRYRGLFEHSPIPMLLIDPVDGTIQDANPGAVAFYGWSRTALIGRNISTINILTPEQVRRQMISAVTRRRHQFDFRHRRADGSIRDVEVHSGPIETAGKTLLFSIIIDVTDRMRQRQDHGESQSVLEEAQRIAQIGHFDVDIPAETWSGSPVLDAILGIDDTYVRTLAGALALVHHEDRPRIRATLADTLLADGRPFDQTYRVRRYADGEVRWVHGRGRLSLNAEGRPARLLGTIQDVTDRELGYLRLNDAIRDLQWSQRIGGMGSWCFDPASQGFRVSDQFCHIHRIAPVPGLLARTEFLALHGVGDRGALSEGVDAASRDGVPLDRVVMLAHDDGTPRWVHIIGQPDPDGGPAGTAVRGIIQDITIQEQARAELRQATDAANRTKSEFLANVSHEIRTPLNAVIGFAEVLASETFGPIDNPRYKEYGEHIVRSGTDLLNLVSDIIDLSRLEFGAMELMEDRLDVAELFQAVVRLFSMRARARDSHLCIDVPATVPMLYADSLRLRQILGNLVSNALKFTPPGGTVTLSAALDDDGGCRLSVTDTGVGIASNQVDRALSVFGRGSDAYVRGQEGAGLGLPLCHRLAAMHGASLRIDSEPGHGTTVTVAFPRNRVVRSGNGT
ncbi:PAS domain S-box protein [Roseospira visakhapatnamensis]|uniref:histidine kinase n=1 Tax=Roseospira visakhapatnamensis TaxID=390880 RepID=A0A7W6RCL0_9PROT|nr:PAS domain S-box-containing protein [Roseospira visakhapatnamensis]